MPPQEQAELWMQLRDRMRTNWSELTLAEKKACEYPPGGSVAPSHVIHQGVRYIHETYIPIQYVCI